MVVITIDHALLERDTPQYKHCYEAELFSTQFNDVPAKKQTQDERYKISLYLGHG